MRAAVLDRRALLGRLVTKLRAECLLYGCDEIAVRRWPIERLMRERDRALRSLITTAPTRRG